MERQVGKIGGEGAQARRIDSFDEQLVERPGEILGEAERFGRVDPADMLLDEARQQEQSLERLDRGRQVLPLPQRLQRPADPLVQLGIADRHQPGQEQSSSRAPDEGVGDGPGGAVVGDENDALREPHVAAAEARDQPRRERVGEGAVRRNGEDAGAGGGHGLK